MKTLNSNVYTDNGYTDRKEYLESLADEYGLSNSEVYMIAEILGESEDFDGLISSLEDYEMSF